MTTKTSVLSSPNCASRGTETSVKQMHQRQMPERPTRQLLCSDHVLCDRHVHTHNVHDANYDNWPTSYRWYAKCSCSLNCEPIAQSNQQCQWSPAVVQMRRQANECLNKSNERTTESKRCSSATEYERKQSSPLSKEKPWHSCAKHEWKVACELTVPIVINKFNTSDQ